MNGINWVQLGIEAAGLVIAILILYWKQRVEAEHRFTKLETMVAGLSQDHEELKGEITNLHGRVGGISKAVAELKGRLHE